MPSVVNLNGYGARVATDFVEPGYSGDPHYKFRSRMRGEVFDQPARVNYIFGDEVKPLPMSLCVFHDQRLIVAEFDIATLTSLTAEYPNLSRLKRKFGLKLLSQLRAQYDGIWAKLVRQFCRQRESIFVEGPFIPHEPGIALVSLVIRVGRDSNFDSAYRIAKRFLELHPENEERERFQKIWKPEDPKLKNDGYQWSTIELRAIESMAPLEPTDPDDFGFNRTEEERIRFNEITWKKCQLKLEQRKVNKTPTRASDATDELLKTLFSRV